jgi:hypothetical protein
MLTIKQKKFETESGANIPLDGNIIRIEVVPEKIENRKTIRKNKK